MYLLQSTLRVVYTYEAKFNLYADLFSTIKKYYPKKTKKSNDRPLMTQRISEKQ
jgi:hypothetical protein